MFILKVCRGETVEDAEPVLVTSAAAVVRAVGEALARELGVESPEVRALTLVGKERLP